MMVLYNDLLVLITCLNPLPNAAFVHLVGIIKFTIPLEFISSSDFSTKTVYKSNEPLAALYVFVRKSANAEFVSLIP